MSIEWYVINTFSGHENKVQNLLIKKIESLGMEEQIPSVKIPTMEVVEMKDGKKKIRNKKIFPGYVMLEMEINDDTVTLIKGIPSVTGFVGVIGDGPPKPLTRQEVDAMFSRTGESGETEKMVLDVEYSIGENVKVVDGPFVSFTGIVEEVYPEKARVKVKVEIFGRATPVELNYDQVDKI